VYEHIVFDESLPHVPFASISQSANDRTVSVYSAGKTFSATGWKIGWAVGPAPLICRLQTIHQFTVFSVASTLQTAVAIALDAAVCSYEGYGSYYLWLAATYREKRNHFLDTLQSTSDLDPIVPDGAFFVMARHGGDPFEAAATAATLPSTSGPDRCQMPEFVADLVQRGELVIDPATVNRPDYNYCRALAVNKAVVGIPPSAFYCARDVGDDLARNFVRFAFSKQVAVLEAARLRLYE
jgi:kynurenine---oxoglutarate transaminase / cysteine-S-conjugate beta-lyase / glutamine---phenylpyruvate transaminase